MCDVVLRTPVSVAAGADLALVLHRDGRHLCAVHAAGRGHWPGRAVHLQREVAHRARRAGRFRLRGGRCAALSPLMSGYLVESCTKAKPANEAISATWEYTVLCPSMMRCALHSNMLGGPCWVHLLAGLRLHLLPSVALITDTAQPARTTLHMHT